MFELITNYSMNDIVQ